MRELKFRAWCDSEFLEDVAPYDNNEIVEQYDCSEWFTKKVDCIEQYTGLKDTNGKEIYEGDIMEYDACLYRVFWDKCGFTFEHIGEHGWTSQDVFSEGKVVGNIHENPELIGGKK